MAGINEEEVKIRERLTSLETKLGFIQGLLQEIRDELKDQPTKDDYDFLQGEITTVKTEVADFLCAQPHFQMRKRCDFQ